MGKQVELGKKYKDKITGCSGVATARTVYMTGCVRILLETGKKDKEENFLEYWFDESRLIDKENPTEGPASDPVGCISRN